MYTRDARNPRSSRKKTEKETFKKRNIKWRKTERLHEEIWNRQRLVGNVQRVPLSVQIGAADK